MLRGKALTQAGGSSDAHASPPNIMGGSLDGMTEGPQPLVLRRMVGLARAVLGQASCGGLRIQHGSKGRCGGPHAATVTTTMLESGFDDEVATSMRQVRVLDQVQASPLTVDDLVTLRPRRSEKWRSHPVMCCH